MSLASAEPASARISALPLDTHRIAAERFGNDGNWYVDNIPFWDSSDPRLDEVYYYRWKIVRAHQRDLGPKGFITTEFLDDVGWQREPYASLNDATGFHLYEARWLRDRRYADDYINYLYEDGGNDRHFSEAIADAVWARYLVDGDRAAAIRHLSAMRHLYGAWDDHFDFSKGLYWIEPLLDATEYTISSIDASGGKDGFTGGQSFRPSINSYMAANARAIAAIAALAGDGAVAADYEARSEALRRPMLAALWSPSLGHFVDRFKVDNAFVHYWAPIRGRELVGYLPWTFGLVSGSDYRDAWAHLLDRRELAGAAGLRTVEPSYPFYMRQFRYDKATGRPECQWNGPAWPFQTTQVLQGLANYLRQDRHGRVASADDWFRLFRQYAALHYQDGRLDLEEDYDPDTGRPIVGLERSHHYFHSGFDDLLITTVAGLVPQSGNKLVVDPLVPSAGSGRLRWFALQNLPYKGRLVSIVWDQDGRHYQRGAGLRVWLDGRPVARRGELGRLEVGIMPRPLPAIARPVDLAVQLVRNAYPLPSASSNAAPEALHDAVDGRIWFFPELANGWTSAANGQEQWYALELGREQRIGSAALAFFANGGIVAPDEVRLERWAAGQWVAVATARTVLANGITQLRFSPVRTNKVRLVMAKPIGKPVRLVELKLFD
ncbi:glycogen debranching protein [Sphingomonas ginkgonis]|uniref:Glycogen debranching protein n=1 Tax=Sphingomonas ginkgonis TaxID=2315330 RepID=A0A429VEG1_9SPHN|nr:glycogen debranching protein [Sphingomonas ginkgonis]